MSTVNVLLGTLAGLAIGATAGILLAPEKGSTTRRQIRNKKNDYVDGLKSKVNEFSDSIADKFEGTKKDAERFVDKGKAKYGDLNKDEKNAAPSYKQESATSFEHAKP